MRRESGGRARRARVFMPIVVLLAAAGAAPAPAAVPSAASWPGEEAARNDATASVSGVVLGPDGARLPGASLVLRRDGEEVMRGASGDQGVFRLRGLPPGRYHLVCSLTGFEPSTVPVDGLAPGESRSISVLLALATLRESLTVLGAASRDSLEAAAIRESPAADVGEALSALPGVFALRKGGIASDVVVRALQRADVNVLVDGQRIHGACPNRMDPPAFHADFAEVERIDVAKGPFDVRYQGSLGGVVNVVTRRPERGLRITPFVSVGSFARVNPSLTASWGGEAVSALVGLSYRVSDAYRDGSGTPFTASANYRPGVEESDSYRVGTGWAQLGWQLAERHRLQVGWTRQEARHVLYPYLSMDGVSDDADRVNVVYEAGGVLGPATSLSAQAYYSRVDHWMTDELRVSSQAAPRSWSMGTQADTETGGARLEARLGWGSFGVEAYRHTWDAETQMAGMQYRPQAAIPGAVNEAIGVFVEGTRDLGASVSLVAGARLDHVSAAADAARANVDLYEAYWGTRSLERSDTLPSGKLRLEWEAGGGLDLAATLGHTTRVAEGNERYFALRRMGTDWVGNPGLGPARSTGLDLAASWRRGGALLSASVYANRVDGFITVVPRDRTSAVPGVMNAAARTWDNVDATLWGVEANAVLPLLGRAFLSADATWTRGRQETDPAAGRTDRDLAEMPPLRARLALRYDDGRLFGQVQGVFSADQEHVDSTLGEERTPGWGVAHLTLGYRRGRLSVAAGIFNVFDRLYTEHLSYQRDPFRTGVRVPASGRSAFVNVTAGF